MLDPMGSPVKFAHPMKPYCSHPTCAGGQVCEAAFDRWEFTVVSLAAPLAIEGQAHDVPFYFRARHGAWRLELGKRTGPMFQGDTDDFTVPSAIELIMKTIDAWIWEKA